MIRALFDYDASGNLVKVTDPVTNATTSAYNALDRLTGETNSLGLSRSYQHDLGATCGKPRIATGG